MRTLEQLTVDACARQAESLSGPPAQWNPRSIFVLRNNDIGDLLIVTPLFECLRRRFPATEIVAGVGEWAAPVLIGNPHLSRVFPLNAPWFNKYSGARGPWRRLRYVQRSPEVDSLRRERFEVGIDVLGSSWGHLLFAQARIPGRLGVRGYAGGLEDPARTVPFDPEEHVGRTALRLAELLGARELPSLRPQIFLRRHERERGDALWPAAETSSRTRVLVAPGGGVNARRWPIEAYADLLARITQRDDADVLLVTGPAEEELVARLREAAPRVRAPQHVLTLREAFAAVAAADLVVANSSMLMHAAAAFDKPALVLLGPGFRSARDHQRQWGYEGITTTLGPEAMQAPPSVDEAALVLRRMLESRR